MDYHSKIECINKMNNMGVFLNDITTVYMTLKCPECGHRKMQLSAHASDGFLGVCCVECWFKANSFFLDAFCEVKHIKEELLSLPMASPSGPS